MKNVLILIALLPLSIYAITKEKIHIKAMSAVELTYEEFASYDVKISNSSGKPINVSVIDPDTQNQVSGFGLGPMGKAVLSIKDGHILKLKNNGLKDLSLSIDFVEREPKSTEKKEYVQRVKFTLRNSTLKSIPLIIPNVMNPNLSPMSNSGVELEMGQKIYYKSGLSKKLILTVDENIKNGEKVDVAALIKAL